MIECGFLAGCAGMRFRFPRVNRRAASQSAGGGSFFAGASRQRCSGVAALAGGAGDLFVPRCCAASGMNQICRTCSRRWRHLVAGNEMLIWRHRRPRTSWLGCAETAQTSPIPPSPIFSRSWYRPAMTMPAVAHGTSAGFPSADIPSTAFTMRARRTSSRGSEIKFANPGGESCLTSLASRLERIHFVAKTPSTH